MTSSIGGFFSIESSLRKPSVAARWFTMSGWLICWTSS